MENNKSLTIFTIEILRKVLFMINNIIVLIFVIAILIIDFSFVLLIFGYLKRKLFNRRESQNIVDKKCSFFDTIMSDIKRFRKLFPEKYRKFLPYVVILFMLIISYYSYNEYQTALPDGTYCYKVAIKSGNKEYLLPAEVNIISYTEYDETEYDDTDIPFRGTRFSIPEYHKIFNLSRAYWPNGGYLDFDYYDDEDNMYFDRYTTLSDQNDKEWECMLTTQRTTHPKVVEQFEDVSKKDIYYVAFTNFILLLYLTIWFLKHKKANFPKGSLYSGNYKEGMYNGKGKLELPCGDSYVGEFEDGEYNGYGEYFYVNGSKLSGYWKYNNLEYGTMALSNGGVYTCSLKNGTLSDPIVYTYSNGDEYVGEWKDEKHHGKGTYTYASGAKYIGEFKDNKFHGQGIMVYISGNIYESEWNDDVSNGQGKIVYKNGGTYVGEWEDFKPNGQGTLTDPIGDVYVGNFKDGVIKGQGTINYSNGNLFTGELFDQPVHGTLSYKNGDVYFGEFLFEARWGEGTMKYANGDIYIGEWEDNKRNGQGKYTKANGEIITGEFKDDAFIG